MEWIKITDNLPKEAQFILVWGSHVMPWMAQFIEDKFLDIEDNDRLVAVTHWMPLPTPPDKE